MTETTVDFIELTQAFNGSINTSQFEHVRMHSVLTDLMWVITLT
jgi:hypothetical protein